MILVVVVQFAILLSVYLSAVLPVWVGEEVRLQVEGYDPRSLFRGNYARLRYPIVSDENIQYAAEECSGCIDTTKYDVGLRTNEIVYIKLKDCASGVCANGGVVLHKPADGLYLRGRLQYDEYGYVWIDFPAIEVYFASAYKAMVIEDRLGDGDAIAVLRVLPGSGRAAIVDLQFADGSYASAIESVE